MQGKLIVFEGIEGCGKTTQIQRSLTWLLNSDILQTLQDQGQVSQVVVTREPGGTAVGQEVRRLLLNPTTQEPMNHRTELLLYASDRAQHVEAWLKPKLAEGMLILCDRYTDSTVAYQGYGRKLDLNLIDQLNHIATNGLTSDLTLWLDLDVEVGLTRVGQRGKRDRMEQADLAFHRRVKQGFVQLAAAHPERIVRVDASLSEEQVSQQIQDILLQRLRAWYPLTLTIS
jgi:dTMP kinase